MKVYAIKWVNGKEHGIVDDLVYTSEAVAHHVYHVLIGQMMQVSDEIFYEIKEMLLVQGDVAMPIIKKEKT